jgi:hypothetical protein
MYVHCAGALGAFYDGERIQFGRELRKERGQRSESRIAS